MSAAADKTLKIIAMINFKSVFILTMLINIVFPVKQAFISNQDNDKKYIKTELFFGLNRIDGTRITESEWEAFADTVISKTYTKGATILKCDGRWLDGESLIKEESRIVVYFSRIYEMTDEFSGEIDLIREKYKLHYQQQAVLRTDEFINASF